MRSLPLGSTDTHGESDTTTSSSTRWHRVKGIDGELGKAGVGVGCLALNKPVPKKKKN